MSGGGDIKSLSTHIEVTLTGDIDPRRLLMLARHINQHDSWDARQSLMIDASECDFHRSLRDLDIPGGEFGSEAPDAPRTVWICKSDHCSIAAQTLEMLLSRSGGSHISFAPNKHAGRTMFVEPLDA
jgi:hypothetical protein